ncbi:hypothetical protein H6G89_31840 [Oscillatoria sp. FACHB-1407]|uniref:plasmid replication protein, CyRepA1 family n=1 Tax=Oscillatoria sp. FACHB-1407 TaxID=2692847 RepID=UPI00168919ED|nr:plasmid replication protein, CyRepA1 family [Oscillatoria sp. FACHB-1407]MBD2465587.1 hypothetical protein [Oscillatoria sp. FACHB-1407]
MSKFIEANRRNGACEVCGDETGKCRRKNDIHLCMTYSDARKGQIENGFKCISNKNNGWATFKIDHSKEWSDEQKREWQAKNLQRRQQQQTEAAARQARSLPEVERDKQYRALLAELELHPEDRADLVRRGFTQEQIDLCGFKSVERYQQLQGRYNDLLPGVGVGGRQLVNFDAGYLCPIRNKDGLIVACQVRLRHLRDGEKNRYRWLTSATKNRPDGQTSHLYPQQAEGAAPQGELPIAVSRPSDAPIGIGLVEGTGAKPFLTSQRLNLLIISAAGGLFASSPKFFQEALEAASNELGKAKEIILYPDAGDVQNRHVMDRWGKLYALLKSWEYSLKIAWWGQVSKDNKDIDELPASDYNRIQFIEFDQFRAIAVEHGGVKLTRQATLKQAQQSLQSLQAEIDERNYQSLSRLTREPWKRINTSNLDLEALGLERNAIYVICSAKGTGKTEALIPFVPQFSNVYAWFNRIALGREETERIGLIWKDDMKSFAGTLKVGFCSNSAHQFNPRLLQTNGLLLGDEFDQLADHNFGDTCNKGGVRPMILSSLKAQIHAALAGGGLCLFMSADITDKDVEYIERLAPPETPVRLIVNDYRPKLGEVRFDESKTPDRLISELLQQLEKGQPCFVIDDLKSGIRGCKSIAEYIRRLHPEWAKEILEINGDTSGDPQVIESLRVINKASEKFRLICCSPSVVSGISIQNGRFSKGVFGFFNGILVVSQASQAIARNRGAKLIRVWAAERGVAFAANRSTDPAEIKAWYQRNYQANCKHLLSFGAEYNPMTSEWDSPHFDLFCKNAAYRNACMTQFRQRFKERLKEEGYEVKTTHKGGDKFTEAGLQAAWWDIKVSRAHAIANAELLSESELNRLLNAPKAPDPIEQLSIEKTLLLRRFGQELIDKTVYEYKSGELRETFTGFVGIALKNERGQYARQLEAFYLLQADVSEAIAKDLAPEERQMKETGERFGGDVRWHTRQKRTREWLKVPDYLKPERWYYPGDLAQLGDQSRQQPGEVKDSLNLSTANLYDGQIYTELLGQLGLETEWEWQTSAEGNRYKRRRISKQSWEYAQMYVRYRESQKDLQADSTESMKPRIAPATGLESESDHPPHNFLSKASLGGDQAENFQESDSPPIESSSIVETLSEATSSASSGSNSPTKDLQFSKNEVFYAVCLIEVCQSLQAFSRMGQEVFKGKSANFWHCVFQFLSPEMRERVFGWFNTLSPLSSEVT